MTEEQVQPKKKRVPVGMWIAAIVFLLLGLFVAPRLVTGFSEEQLSRNAILSGIPFLMVFISIILFYMSAIWWMSIQLNDRVPHKTYKIIEYVIIGGIILGVVMMFQPWVFELFRWGFYLLLASTLAFIAWSHVSPADPVDVVAAELAQESS